VREIEHVLVVGVAVDRGHRSLEDREVLVQHLDHGGQANWWCRRRWRGCCACRIVGGIVDAQDQRDIFVLGRAEMMTFFTEPRRCLAARVASVNLPVDSMTIWAPREVQSSSAGSLVAKTLIFLPLTEIESASAFTSAWSVPRTESYLSK